MPELRRFAEFSRTLLLDPWSSGRLVWSVVGVFFVISVCRYTLVTLPNLDASWLLLAAERMLAGGTYLDNFFEVNWPMAIMIYCPGILLSRLLEVDAYTGLLISYFLLIGVSVVTVDRLLRRVIPTLPAVTGILVVAYAWVLLFPHHTFGQREHLAIVLFLPFVIAAAGRAAGVPLDSRFAEIGIGAAAAIGALVKPHFIIFPAAIFIVRLLRQRSWRVFCHSDVLIFLAFGVAYGAVVGLLYPGWLEVASRALQFYSAYNAGWDGLLRTGGTGLALAIPILIGNRFAAIPSAAKALVFHLGVIAVVASVIFLLQRKGWSYQFFPAKVALTLLVSAFAAALLVTAEPSRTPLRPPYASLFVLMILSMGLLPVARDIWRDYHRLVRYDTAPITQMVRAISPGAPMFVFSADVSDAFPMVLLEKRNWASRFPSLWLVPGIAAQLSEAQTASRRVQLQTLRQRAIEMTLTDFRRHRPGLVLVPIEVNKRWFKTEFDFLAFYRSDPAFDAIWRGYRAAGRAGNFEFYVRAEP